MDPTGRTIPATSKAAVPQKPTPQKSELRNSLWCVDKSGKVGKIDTISGSDALFRHFSHTDEDGIQHYGELTRVPLEDLTQAKVAELPEDHGMAPAELKDLGYQ